MAMLLNIYNENLGATVIIEDDDKVCYAYLVVDESISSDVWLYNVCDAPSEPEWIEGGEMPFANSVAYISSERMNPITTPSDVALDWISKTDSCLEVRVKVRGVVHALLRSGAKPGWCRLAVKSSPIARPLNDGV